MSERGGGGSGWTLCCLFGPGEVTEREREKLVSAAAAASVVAAGAGKLTNRLGTSVQRSDTAALSKFSRFLSAKVGVSV